ncbi:SUKH-3 domain-containing protein [Dactylosporangium sp. NPDC049140]|uniref:SUKH-3 domain-containing protein n=1 Tax=Dactylosporangium sp. NPDC049140 TaxID=3155647 RepID=UPI0033C506DA
MSAPGRFPSDVETALREAGWEPGRDVLPRARMWGLALASHASPSGHQHTVVPAALAALAEFGGLTVRAEGDGAEVARTGIVFDPLRGLHAASTLAELGELVRSRLTPIGEQDDGAGLLAVDERGRVFVLDHTADWYAGASLDEAIATLLGGRLPARIADDGTWS